MARVSVKRSAAELRHKLKPGATHHTLTASSTLAIRSRDNLDRNRTEPIRRHIHPITGLKKERTITLQFNRELTMPRGTLMA